MKAKVIICIMAVLLLTGCSQNTEVPKNESITYPAADTAGMNVTYIDTGKCLTPISVVKDGNSILSGENYYYNIENTVNNTDGLADKTYTAFACTGENQGTVSLDKRPKSEALITSGNWQLCPEMRYEKKGSKDKVSDEYRQFPAEALPDIFKSADEVGITDIWECDLDGDSANEALIRASGNGKLIIYIMSTTLGNSVLEECGTDCTATPYIADLDGNGAFSLITVSGNSFKTVTVFKEKSTEPEYTVYLPLE